MANDANRLLGQGGNRELDSNDGATDLTGVISGKGFAHTVSAIGGASCTFTSLTDASKEGTQRTLVLGAGEYRYGKFTAANVASGTAIFYF